MFDIELKFKIGGREVPCGAFIDALKTQLVEAVKAAVDQQTLENCRCSPVSRSEASRPRAFSLDETAEALRISKATISRRIREGKIRAIRIGSRVLVSSETIQALLRDGLRR